MGVYSPVPIVTDEEYAAMMDAMERTVAGIRSEGIDYRGVLYGGFILTDEGPKVLEFNARFGDLETQVILPRLEGDLAQILLAAAEGRLAEAEVSWRDDWAVCVVIASGGYPGEYDKGLSIAGVDDADALDDVIVYHAGTAFADGGFVTSGGRVLNVTALGADFQSARDRAYEAVDHISWDGAFHRTDIGAKAARGRDAWKA
jgi:phosphoribosylamine--glycine ligase